jgi:hypothetical protein
MNTERAAAQSEAAKPDDADVNGVLRLSEQLLRDGAFMRAVLAGSGDCIKVLDLDANLIFMSEGGLRVMEIDDFGTFAGCPWPGFWHGEGNAAAHEAVKVAKAGRVGRFRGFAKTAKGTPKWWDVQVAPIPGSDGRRSCCRSRAT